MFMTFKPWDTVAAETDIYLFMTETGSGQVFTLTVLTLKIV